MTLYMFSGCLKKSMSVEDSRCCQMSMVQVRHAHRRFQQWSTSKVFQRLWLRLLKVYDAKVGIQWKWQSLDSVSVKAPLAGK